MIENKTSSIGLKVALGIAIALFIGAVAVSFSLKKDKDLTTKELTEEKALVMKDLSAINIKYKTAIDNNEIVNENLIDAKDRIQGLIDSLSMAEANIGTLRRYQRKYFRLQNEMDVLLQENDSLKFENRLLVTSLDSTQVELDERIVFTDSLLVQNTVLADVVKNASVLTTTNLKAFGVIERTSGKLIPTERAKRSNKIRVCFTVAKNKLVQAGDKELYVQVLGPDNKVLGGSKQAVFGKKILRFSIVSKFNYENSNIDICEFITKSNDKDSFVKGNYIVNVFNGKELVSNTQFTLK